MAKDRRKLQHIHSSIPDKQPTPATLEVGEIAVNNAKDQEFLSVKNSEDKVVRFSSDGQMIDWVEKKEVIPYSGTVDNVHLDTNRSNIEIKLNQVVAKNTVKYNVVNGAKDIDGQDVNPSSDGGLTNGAGFAIDMSRYAMIGANPSFSSITVTNKSDLSGTTNINGSSLNVTTTTAEFNDKTFNVTTISGANITAGDNVCIKSDKDADFYGSANTKVGVSCEGDITKRAEMQGEYVVINATTNNVGITAKNNIIAVSTENDIIITANKNICETAGVNASFYGVTKTNVGLNCDDSSSSTTTNVYGNTINIYAPTINISGNTNISGDTYIGKKLYITSGLSEPLIWQYGSVCNANSGTTNFSANTAAADRTITIPKTISDVTCGDVTNSNECLNIGKSVCVSGTVTSTQGMYTSSDVNLKNTIGYISGIDLHKANKVNLKSFKYNTDPTGRKVYGVIAQDVEEAGLNELVFVDENGLRSVDYTGLLILKLAALEKEVSMLRHQLRQMTEDNKD